MARRWPIASPPPCQSRFGSGSLPRRFKCNAVGRGSTAQQVRLVALGNEERTNEHGGEYDPPPHWQSEVGAGWFGRRRRRRDCRLALPANALVVRVVLTAGWTVHKQSQTENWAKSVERIVTRSPDQDGARPSDETVSVPWDRTLVEPRWHVSGWVVSSM